LKSWWQRLRDSFWEVLLIVAGIFIAFLLDAWWDGRIEQAEVREALRAVQEDFLATDAELSAVLEANRTYISRVTRLIALDVDEVAGLDSQELATLAGLVPTGGLTFDPVLGSVDALISGGHLHRIRNIALRSAIAAWPARLDEIGEDHEILIDTYMFQQERSVQLGIYLLQFKGEVGDQADLANAEAVNLVVRDEEMLNRLAAHRFAVRELDRELESVETQIKEILSLLDHEL
jgi:hypothetical protein